MKLMFVSLNVYWTLKSCGLATFPLGPDLVIRDSQPPKKIPEDFLLQFISAPDNTSNNMDLRPIFFGKIPVSGRKKEGI